MHTSSAPTRTPFVGIQMSPHSMLDEGIERCKEAVKLGAKMTTVVKLTNLKDATYVAKRVPGWKMYPDVAGKDGKKAHVVVGPSGRVQDEEEEEGEEEGDEGEEGGGR